jgi:hypothetical protein
VYSWDVPISLLRSHWRATLQVLQGADRVGCASRLLSMGACVSRRWATTLVRPRTAPQQGRKVPRRYSATLIATNTRIVTMTEANHSFGVMRRILPELVAALVPSIDPNVLVAGTL